MEHVGSIALKNEPTRPKPLRKPLPKDSVWLLGMLTSLALARQETVSTETFEVYLRALSGFSRELLEAAIERLMVEKSAYAKPFPTTAEIAELCRAVAAAKPRNSRFCGRCNEGYIRLGGEVVMCECCCRPCGGSGVVFVKSDGQPWGGIFDQKAERYARKCPDCRKEREIA